MKQETKILAAIGIGFFAVLGVCALRKKLFSKKTKKHNLYLYTDEHRHFDICDNNEDNHGVELHALK